LSKLSTRRPRLQLARDQLARLGSNLLRSDAHWSWPTRCPVADQLARLQLARSKSVHDCGVALQLARDQLEADQLARDQLREAVAASDQLARDHSPAVSIWRWPG